MDHNACGNRFLYWDDVVWSRRREREIMEHLLHQESKEGRRTALFNLRRVQTAACVGVTIGAGIVALMLKAI